MCKTDNPDIFDSACGDKDLLCDNYKNYENYKAYSLFEVLYDYWMKLLGADYNCDHYHSINSLENKGQLTEKFFNKGTM